MRKSVVFKFVRRQFVVCKSQYDLEISETVAKSTKQPRRVSVRTCICLGCLHLRHGVKTVILQPHCTGFFVIKPNVLTARLPLHLFE